MLLLLPSRPASPLRLPLLRLSIFCFLLYHFEFLFHRFSLPSRPSMLPPRPAAAAAPSSTPCSATIVQNPLKGLQASPTIVPIANGGLTLLLLGPALPLAQLHAGPLAALPRLGHRDSPRRRIGRGSAPWTRPRSSTPSCLVSFLMSRAIAYLMCNCVRHGFHPPC